MGEEGGRKPSLDNPEYFLFPEEPPPGINRFPEELAAVDRFPGQPATMDRRTRAVSQGGVIEELMPPTEIMESLERIESLGERAAKGRRPRVSLSSLRRFFTTATRRGSSSGQANEYMPSPAGREATTSLPTTPSKVPSFLQYPTLGRTRKTVVKRLSGPPTAEAQGEAEPSPRYYNLEANNNCAGVMKEASKPMKLGQPIDGRLGRAREKPPVAPASKTRVLRREKVAGMEAPAPPSFHLVCRGVPSAEQSIALLYSASCPSASLAAINLQKSLASPSRKVVGVEVEELVEGEERNRDRLSEILYHARAQVLLISASLLACLQQSGASMSRLLIPWRTIAILCNIGQAQVEESALEFRHIPLWIEMEQEKSGKWQQVVAVKVVNLLEERQQPEEAAWRLFPRKVSQSQPKVQISLEVGLPANPPLELNLTLNNTSYTLLDAKWLKQDLLQVELPPTLFRSTSIGTAALIIDGSHLGSRQLKLENAATMLESIWQATSDPVSLLSDAFSASFSGLAEIDDFLKASIEERLSVADLLGRPGHHQPQGDENLVGDHATLLHFAATHGLARLATSLLSLGHSRFLKVPNILGLTPAECADRAGHPALARQLRQHHPPQQPCSDPDVVEAKEKRSLHEGSDGYLLPSLVLSEEEVKVPQGQLQASVKAVEEDWYRVPPRPSPIQPYMVCGSRTEVKGSQRDILSREHEPNITVSESDKTSTGSSEGAGSNSPAFIVQPQLTGRPSGSYLPMAPLVTATATIRKTKSVISPPTSLLPGPIAKSHSFSVCSPRIPVLSQNQASSRKFSDLVLGDQAFQGRAVSRQELLKSFTSSSDEASPALTLLQQRPESTPPVMQQHRPLLMPPTSMSSSTSDMLEGSPPMSASTSNMLDESFPSFYILEKPTSTTSLLDPASSSILPQPSFISTSTLAGPDHHSSNSYLGSSCGSSNSSKSGMTGSPPSPAPVPPSSSISNSPTFPVFVHTEGRRDGIVALPGEEGDEEQELVEYYEQGKISEVQLENYRRNSVTREPLDGENQSPSSASRWRMKDVVSRFSPVRPKLGLKGSLKRRRKVDDEGEDRGRIREVMSMEALEDDVLNLTHNRSANRSSCDVDDVRVSLPPKIRSRRQGEGSSSSSPHPTSVSASSSLYSIPRQLIAEGSSLRRAPKSTSGRLVNRNLGVYENVVASARIN